MTTDVSLRHNMLDSVPRIPNWAAHAAAFLASLEDSGTGAARSVPGGKVTLYGTCYAALGRFYVSGDFHLRQSTRDFIANCQDPDTGLMLGPELRDFYPAPQAVHDREHLALHSTCSALPACQQFNVPLKYPVKAAHRFCDLDYLSTWLARRDLHDAWLEGNNLLFVGQLLVYLRDVEQRSDAQAALDHWFKWLDDNIDPATGLWGTNGFCSPANAIYGGYHQLLLYYYEEHRLANPQGLIDTVLDLQYRDGGFAEFANAGACEDVDSVDILVNLYKRFDYRRADIRSAVRRCANHILATQNADGGFPYDRSRPQSHMGIPGTQAAPKVSTAFATWFRVHTLALCAQIIPEHRAFQGATFRFSGTLSMGWHQSPSSWEFSVDPDQARHEMILDLQAGAANYYWSARRLGGKVFKKLGLR